MTLLEHTLKREGLDLKDGDNLKMGKGDNYLEVSKENGTPRLRGTGTVWKDMVADLFGKKLESEAGKVSYDYEENVIVFASGGAIATSADRVGGNQEINHEFKVGDDTSFVPHIHWFQDAGTKFEITLQYRIQRNGEAKTTAWTDLVITANDDNDIYPYVSGTLVQITSGEPITIDCNISDTVQFRMARTDTLGGTMNVLFFDLHAEVDSFGSNGEFSKEA